MLEIFSRSMSTFIYAIERPVLRAVVDRLAIGPRPAQFGVQPRVRAREDCEVVDALESLTRGLLRAQENW